MLMLLKCGVHISLDVLYKSPAGAPAEGGSSKRLSNIDPLLSTSTLTHGSAIGDP